MIKNKIHRLDGLNYHWKHFQKIKSLASGCRNSYQIVERDGPDVESGSEAAGVEDGGHDLGLIAASPRWIIHVLEIVQRCNLDI
jgi:hypothetical protein